MVRRGPPCKLVWREPGEARVRAVAVVVVLPLAEYVAGVGQAPEHGLVQELISEPAVERLHEAVLHRLARRDVMPGNSSLLLPAQERHRRELSAIVADQ